MILNPVLKGDDPISSNKSNNNMVMQVEVIAESFNNAIKSSDEARVIRELCAHSNKERQEVKRRYLIMFGHSLDEDLKSKFSGHFLEACMALLVPADEFEARCIYNAFKGWRSNEKVIIEALCTKDCDEIVQLRDTYNFIFDRNLEKDIEKEETGWLGRLLRSLCTAGRDKVTNSELDVKLELAKLEAKELYDAGQGRVGTNEMVFIRIFCTRSFKQLQMTFNEYKELCGYDIEQAVIKEFSGLTQFALLAIIKSIRNKPSYFAELLYEAMKGIGTRDSDLIRILVLRSEIDLNVIKFAYAKMYNKSLYDAVKDDTSGNYQRLLLTLIGKD